MHVLLILVAFTTGTTSIMTSMGAWTVFYLQDYLHYNSNLDDVVFYLQDYPHYNPNLDDVVFYLQDYPHYNPNQEAQLRQLAENHGRQMEYLQIKNKDLEKQREGIY